MTARRCQRIERLLTRILQRCLGHAHLEPVGIKNSRESTHDGSADGVRARHQQCPPSGSHVGAALRELQDINGRWFSRIQGGLFAPGPGEELVRRMIEWGASGVGQSSWGPTVYGIVDDEDAGRALADRVREWLGAGGTVHHGPFRAEGARVTAGTLEATQPELSPTHEGFFDDGPPCLGVLHRGEAVAQEEAVSRA